jgi:hypothetical protein
VTRPPAANDLPIRPQACIGTNDPMTSNDAASSTFNDFNDFNVLNDLNDLPALRSFSEGGPALRSFSEGGPAHRSFSEGGNPLNLQSLSFDGVTVA